MKTPTWTEWKHSVADDAIDQRRKRLEAWVCNFRRWSCDAAYV